MLNINELTRLYLGCQGENQQQTIQIDVSPWLKEFPNGTITIWHKRNGDTVPQPMAGVVLDRENGILSITPTNTDTYVSGEGSAEVRLTQGNVVKKTREVITGVSPAVTGSGQPLGSGWQDYIDAIERAAQVAILKDGLIKFEIDDNGHLIFSYTEDVPVEEEDDALTGQMSNPVWKSKDLGPVDAYAEAVAAGYTGTIEEWLLEVGSVKENAQAAAGSAAAAAGSATDANTAKTAAQTAQEAAETAAARDTVAWLEENISPITADPPLDRTLSANTAAAPADIVGDLKNALYSSTGNKQIDMTTGAYYPLDGSSITIGSPTPYGTEKYALIPCSPGDVFTVSGTGGSTAKPWGFVESDGTIIKTRDNSSTITITKEVIIAPEDASYLVLNNQTSDNGISYYGKILVDEVETLNSAFDFESVFGSINLIRPFKKPSGTERGVTFSWNGSKVTITGTSTESLGWVLYQDKANLPEGIEAGKSYHVKFSSTDIIFRVYAYDANEEATQILSTKEDTELVIPNNAVGISFRLYQVANKTFNETVYAPVVYADYDNIELRKEIDVLNAISNQEAIALFRNKGDVPTFIDDGSNLKVKVPAQLRVIGNIYGDGVIGNQAAEYTLEPSKFLTANLLLETLSVKLYSEILPEDVVLIGLTAASGVIGQWAPYYYIQKIKDDFNKKDIPDYYFEDNYLPDKVDTINEIAVELGSRSFQTFFITDYHTGYNARNSVPLIQYLVKNTGIHNVSFGGDGITHDYTSKNAGYSLLCEFLNDFKGIEDVANVYYITGNHEMNDADGTHLSSRLSQQTPYRLFNGRMQGDVYNLYGTVMAYSMNGTPYNYICNETNTFYVDFNAEKIRCIYVDTLFNSKISEDSVVAAFSALETVPDGYAVLIVSHRAVATTGNVSEGTFRITGVYERFRYIMEAAKAMNDGSEVTVDAAFTYDVVEHHNYHFDFTGKQRQFIGVLCGHVHYDGYYIYDNRFPVILTTCDCIDNAAGIPAYRIRGKVSEQAFDVVQINIDTETPANNRIYLTRVGWGEDREFSFGVQGAGLIE